MTVAARVARYAYRYWRRHDMEAWPTVATAAHALRLRRSQVEEEAGELYGLEGYGSPLWRDPPLGNLYVYATTREVDVVWCAYWRAYSPCVCGEHMW